MSELAGNIAPLGPTREDALLMRIRELDKANRVLRDKVRDLEGQLHYEKEKRQWQRP